MRIFAILFAIFIVCFAATFPVRIVEQSTDKITLRWQNDGDFKIIPSISGNFSEILWNNADYLWDEGKPHLPVFHVPVIVGKNVYVDARIIGDYDVELTESIIPAQSMKAQQRGKLSAFNSSIYSSKNPFPKDAVRIVQSGVLHGDNFIVLEICPIKYFPADNKLIIADEIEITLHSDKERNHFSSPIFDPIKRRFFINSVEEEPPYSRAPAKMLVLCPSYYRLSLEPWLEWKRQIGFSIDVRTPDELGGTVSSIDDSIDAIYDEWGGIDYLVIVGDVEDVPTHDTGGSDSPTDIDYGCVDGDDYVPDMLIGRISVENIDQLEELVARFIEYEKFSYIDSAFAERFLFGTSNDATFHDMVHTVHSYVRDNFLTPLDVGYEELDGDYATETDVISALDSGYAYYYYYGHGWSGGLAAPPLTFSGVSSMANSSMYPFIVGNACSTNDFTIDTSFGEYLLRRANAGAIGYIGGSNSTYWYPDSVWEIQTFSAFLADSISSAMGQCYSAFLDVMVSFPDYGHYFFDVYNLIGDPSVQLWAGIPQNLLIDAPAVYVVDMENNIDVNVSSHGSPVANAVVCISWSDSSIVSITNSSGDVELTIPALPPETLTITTTAYRKIPAQSIILPEIPDEPYLYIDSFLPNDAESISIRNDGDGVWDFGETLAVNITITNYGTVDSFVELNITSLDPYLTILDGDTIISVIDSGAEFNYTLFIVIDTFAPNNHIAQVDISLLDSDSSSWEYNRRLTISSPVVQFSTVTISDSLYGDGDYFIEAGETVNVWLYISVPEGCDIAQLHISCNIPDDIDFANLIISDTLLNDIIPSWDGVVAFPMEITDVPDFEFPLIFRWDVAEVNYTDTIDIFAGSPGFESSADNIALWSSEDFGEWSLSTKEFNSPNSSIINVHLGDRFYDNDQRWSLASPEFIVPWNAHLCFWYKLFVPYISSDGDSASIELWTDEDTIQLWELDEPQTHWELAIVEIPSEYSGKRGKIVLKFESDMDNYRKGFYIDDIAVVSGGGFLGDASVNPPVGANGTLYSFGVTYGSTDGSAPISMHIVIDGIDYIMLPEIVYDTPWFRYHTNCVLDEGIHNYYFTFQDNFGTHRFPVDTEFIGPLVGEIVFNSDFESDDGGLTVESPGWYWYNSDTVHSGSKCWNNIGSAAEYDADINAILVWHLDLRELSHPAISFWSNIHFARGSSSGLLRDGGNIKIRTTSSTEIIEPIPGYDGEIISDSNPLAGEPVLGAKWSEKWIEYYIDLVDWSGQEIDIIFNAGTNDLEASMGWFLDDISLIDIGSVDINENYKKPKTLNIYTSPNPFNSSCKFTLLEYQQNNTTIEIFDINGRSVATIEIPTGMLSARWNPENNITSGIYIYRINNNDFNNSNKLMLLR